MSSLNGHMFLFSVRLIVSCLVAHFQNRRTLMAAVVMILRVWAMYNRSTLIFRVLITSFSLEIIANVLATAVISNPTNLSGTLTPAEQMLFCINKLSITTPLVCCPTVTVVTAQMPGYSFCILDTSPTWTQVADILQIMHGAAVCILGIVRFVIQSRQMYRATRQWQPNRYMILLVREGILYFFACVLFSSAFIQARKLTN